jgi:Uncharacterized protein conserved in bacteria
MGLTLIAANLVIIVALIAGVGLTLLALPGNFVILLAALSYGFFEGFVRFNAAFLLALGGAFLVGEAGELVAGMLGARRRNASRPAITAALVGGIAGALLGSVVMPVLGTLAGAAGGAFALSYAAEYGKTGNREQAARVARSVAAGLVVGTLFKLAVAVSMAVAIAARLPW